MTTDGLREAGAAGRARSSAARASMQGARAPLLRVVHRRAALPLRVPCLTLRENAERPITLSRGTSRVVGVDPRSTYTHWHRAADGQWPTGELPELWDGHAARRIVKILLRHTLSPQGRGQGEG